MAMQGRFTFTPAAKQTGDGTATLVALHAIRPWKQPRARKAAAELREYERTVRSGQPKHGRYRVWVAYTSSGGDLVAFCTGELLAADAYMERDRAARGYGVVQAWLAAVCVDDRSYPDGIPIPDDRGRLTTRKARCIVLPSDLVHRAECRTALAVCQAFRALVK